MSKQAKVENIRGDAYYAHKAEAIATLGYKNPSMDVGDPRQIELWNLVKKYNFSIEIKAKYDCEDFYKQDSEYIDYFQTRANGETGVPEMYRDIYLADEALERIPFCMPIGSPTEVACISGNKRMRSHEFAIKSEKKASKCDILLISHPNMTIIEKLEFAQLAARVSNSDELVKQTRPTEKNDYVQQLRGAYKLYCRKRGITIDSDPRTFEQKDEWARTWVTENISDKFSHEHMKSQLGDVVNSVFSEDRGLSVPLPPIEELKYKFEGFWPNHEWDEDHTKVKMLVKASNIQPLERVLHKFWQTQEEASVCSHNRHPFYFIIRCGKTLTTKLTSLKEITHQRKKMLNDFKKWNTIQKLVNHKYPVVEKIMFVKQLATDTNDYTAYEWNSQSEEYNPVERKGE